MPRTRLERLNESRLEMHHCCTERLEINDKRFFGIFLNHLGEGSRKLMQQASTGDVYASVRPGRDTARGDRNPRGWIWICIWRSGDISLGENVHNVLQGKSSRGKVQYAARKLVHVEDIWNSTDKE